MFLWFGQRRSVHPPNTKSTWPRGGVLQFGTEAWDSQGQRSTDEQCSFHPGWLFDIGDEILPTYIGITINQYKDPYKPISDVDVAWWFEQLGFPRFSRAKNRSQGRGGGEHQPGIS